MSWFISALSRKFAIGLIIFLAALLHILAARRLPVGIFNDDAANILLAKSLRHGAYAFPGGLGAPEEFLPAFPLLLAIPTWLVEPHWNLLRAIPLAFAGLCFFLTWRLSRRFLSVEAAAAATLLTALNPIIVGLSGLVAPYFIYLALSLALIDAAFTADRRRSILWLTAGAALAPLLRPQGMILIGSLALAFWHRHGWKRSCAFLFAALLPTIGWTLRNHLSAGASQDYFDIWRMNLAIVGDTPLLERASSLLSTLCGESFLPIPGPLAFQIIFGIVSMFLVFFGIFLLTRKHAGPRIFVLVSYAAGLALIHTTWKWSDIRYLIPFVPLIWILIIAALSKLLHRYRTLQGLLLAISIALSLRTGLVHARAGLHGGAQFQPRTIAWIKENVPATARMASTMKYSIGLLAQRECAGQGLAQDPELWLTAARFHRVEYLHVVLPRPGDEFGLNGFPDNYQFAFARWLETRPEATRLYQNPGEGSLIYRLDRL